MPPVKTIVRQRRIEFPVPDDLPDGTEVLIDVTPIPQDRIGIDESQWSDDAAALEDWTNWIGTIEPIDWTPRDEFDEKFREFNLEAVRKQMEVSQGA